MVFGAKGVTMTAFFKFVNPRQFSTFKLERILGHENICNKKQNPTLI
jgi:hypothetical protein